MIHLEFILFTEQDMIIILPCFPQVITYFSFHLYFIVWCTALSVRTYSWIFYSHPRGLFACTYITSTLLEWLRILGVWAPGKVVPSSKHFIFNIFFLLFLPIYFLLVFIFVYLLRTHYMSMLASTESTPL